MAELVLVVDPDDPTPPYAQLRRQLTDLVGSGRLGPGERLPPLRQLAGDLGLAVGTVARTYRELESDGLVISRRGGGTRVAPGVSVLSEAQRHDRLAALAASYVAQARALGDDSEVLAAVQDALSR